MKRILLIEDNPEIQIFITAVLNEFSVVIAPSLLDAKTELEKNTFSLILLDIELPDGDGIAFYSMIKDDPRHLHTPVMIVTAKLENSKKIDAFSLGVDDFLTKPLDPMELRVRCQARIKKAEKYFQSQQSISFKDLILNTTQQRVWIDTDTLKSVTLTALEYRLLLCFVRAPEKTFSRDNLLKEVWGNDTYVNDRTVDTHLSHLRKKLQGSCVSFETLKGEGYRLTTASVTMTSSK